MANYKRLQYSKSQVKRAGLIFSSQSPTGEERENALLVVNNWRAAHAYPLQVIYVNARKKVGGGDIVVQRLKRLDSITGKLVRFPNMPLNKMQDIAGCRIITQDVDSMKKIVEKIKHSKWKHEHKRNYDYIVNPKNDGYRSYHTVYKYRSDKNDHYNGLYVEIQIRTKHQHMWATAVETMDTVYGNNLKIGLGDMETSLFFQLASALIAIYEESGYDMEKVQRSLLSVKLWALENKKNVLGMLSAISKLSFKAYQLEYNQGYFLLEIKDSSPIANVRYFTPNQTDDAIRTYEETEKEKKPYDNVVLVSADSSSDLRKAYPNYFSDVSEFVQLIRNFIG